MTALESNHIPRIRSLLPGENAKRKTPLISQRGFGYKALAMTYSRMRMHTTIGACAFHFRVRDGIGWFHAAMFTRERVEGRRRVASWEGATRSAHALIGDL